MCRLEISIGGENFSTHTSLGYNENHQRLDLIRLILTVYKKPWRLWQRRSNHARIALSSSRRGQSTIPLSQRYLRTPTKFRFPEELGEFWRNSKNIVGLGQLRSKKKYQSQQGTNSSQETGFPPTLFQDIPVSHGTKHQKSLLSQRFWDFHSLNRTCSERRGCPLINREIDWYH